MQPESDETPRETCIRALKHAAEKLGHSPSQAEYRDLDLVPSAKTITTVCGSWNAAKREAGLRTVPQAPQHYTDAELLQAIRDVHRFDGEQLTITTYERHRTDDEPTGPTIYFRFESFDDARDQALADTERGPPDRP